MYNSIPKGLFNNLSTGKNARKADRDTVPFNFNKDVLNGKTKIKADIPSVKKKG